MSRVHGALPSPFSRASESFAADQTGSRGTAKLPQRDHTAKTGLVVHSDRFVLVDRYFRIRGYYHGTDPEALERLQRDLETLRHEERTGQ